VRARAPTSGGGPWGWRWWCFASLPGLVPALRKPGALLLDVGAGAAGVSLALCRRFPALRAHCLKRYVAREIFGHLRAAPQRVSPPYGAA
jgi:hypothetical protein